MHHRAYNDVVMFCVCYWIFNNLVLLFFSVRLFLLYFFFFFFIIIIFGPKLSVNCSCSIRFESAESIVYGQRAMDNLISGLLFIL